MDLHGYEMERLAGQCGFVTRKTPTDDIRALIRKLHPVRGTQQGLIRLGPDGDGGYLVPDDLTGIEACFSPGVANISGFEKDCAERGMQVFLADKSVTDSAETHPLFTFTPKFVGAITDEHFMTLDDWVNRSLQTTQSDLLLQMDIEEAEYETILSISPELMTRFRIRVIEFHRLEEFWNLSFFKIASHVFEKILQTHSCVHLHPNNCCGSIEKDGLDMPRVMEFTFLRKDHINDYSYVKTFPHSLDQDNRPKPTLKLPQCWYSSLDS